MPSFTYAETLNCILKKNLKQIGEEWAGLAIGETRNNTYSEAWENYLNQTEKHTIIFTENMPVYELWQQVSGSWHVSDTGHIIDLDWAAINPKLR